MKKVNKTAFVYAQLWSREAKKHSDKSCWKMAMVNLKRAYGYDD